MGKLEGNSGTGENGESGKWGGVGGCGGGISAGHTFSTNRLHISSPESKNQSRLTCVRVEITKHNRIQIYFSGSTYIFNATTLWYHRK